MEVFFNILKELPKSNKLKTFFVFIISIFIQFGNISVPFIFQRLTDNFGSEKAFQYFQILLFVYFLQLLLNIFFGIFYTKNIYEISSYYKKRGFEFLLRNNKEINNFSEKIDLLFNLSEEGIASLFYESNVNFVVYIIFYFILLFYILKRSLIVGVLLIANTIVLYIVSRLKIKYLSSKNLEIIRLEAKKIKEIEDILRGFVEIRVFNILKNEVNRISNHFKEILNIIKRKQKIELFISGFEIMNFLVFPAILYIVGISIIEKNISLGEGIKIIQMVEIITSYSIFISNYTNVIPEIISVYEEYSKNFQ
ncbi:hypothetical protein XO10_10230 [Marinitoga sp. 1135]|uniref:ABC transmembrane type-1 domain-containing protein n=1 Tax=Marinitoga piezophila (strain DSM 14283 / JCM 11233 / KA3) TaxID=443254 RepID=H2J7G7_MARPK|nr:MULTISPECIES: ABC transporter ATP-binding protein [Marinitoga]AEX86460.1 hypothetical protein Marpi_2085 [Marinitoga piezophila KA3]NUU96603.1 hypothetical protein [Marinitoga sp. 1135]